MSVRAYRVDEIKMKKSDSFNLWHSEKVCNWLDKNTNFFHHLNMDGVGLVEVMVDDLSNLLSQIGDQLDIREREEIEDDIKVARERGDDYITYYCF